MSATTTQLLSSGEFCNLRYDTVHRGELSYLPPLGSENIAAPAPYFKQCFFQGGYYP